MHTRTLAEWAAALRYEELPEDVIARARDCIQDTVGLSVFGAELPWSRIVVDYVRRYGGPGASTVLGADGLRTSPPFAALANGALVHAFEMDSLRKPSTGVHPGGIVPPALAIGEARGASGREVIAAFVAGMEVTTRIGLATRHSSEEKGFHAPGLTTVFGGAVAAGRLLGLDAVGMTHALGIAGSLCSGIMEYLRGGTGGTVKRLHVGRAAEGGVLAAALAQGGFEGPATVLEGAFGFLHAYADNPRPEALSAGLGTVWETRTICFKRCACHAAAHAPIQGIEELRAAHGFGAADVAAIAIGTSRKVIENQNQPAPGDMVVAQMSVPFAVALSFFREPSDPRSFRDVDVRSPEILELSRRVRLEPYEETRKPGQAWACSIVVTLKDGRRLASTMTDFRGSATQPMSPAELEGKFRASTARLGPAAVERLLSRLRALEAQPSVAGLLEGA
ncbi:MAG: MmgE/PrpD family protein [Candidatus Lambdaproteobacteria bacterium]|nr:MmgE/PrpD family protein [Candidatus Lambdaproteobacteria bacterium]